MGWGRTYRKQSAAESRVDLLTSDCDTSSTLYKSVVTVLTTLLIRHNSGSTAAKPQIVLSSGLHGLLLNSQHCRSGTTVVP